jgi:hypothetical protein
VPDEKVHEDCGVVFSGRDRATMRKILTKSAIGLELLVVHLSDRGVEVKKLGRYQFGANLLADGIYFE